MGDHTQTCAPRCTKDHRSTAEKLRDVANHPRTPANEAEAARNRLRAMGQPVTAPEAKSPYADLFKPFSPGYGRPYHDPIKDYAAESRARAKREWDEMMAAHRKAERETEAKAEELRRAAENLKRTSDRAREFASQHTNQWGQPESAAEKMRRFEEGMRQSFREGFYEEVNGRQGRPFGPYDARAEGSEARYDAKAEAALHRFEARQQERAAKEQADQMRDRQRDEMREARTSASAAAKAANEDARIRRDKQVKSQLEHDGFRVETDEAGNPVGIRSIRRNTFEHSFRTGGPIPPEWFE